MPRQWKRKTDRGVPADILRKAAIEVRQGKSVRSVAKAHSICHVTLNRYCKASQKLIEEGSSEQPHVGYRSSQRVFSEAQEELLTEYLKKAADVYYGLTPQEVRKFAYHLAVDNNCKHPQSWVEKAMAGSDWFLGFMKRHPNLSIRSCPSANPAAQPSTSANPAAQPSTSANPAAQPSTSGKSVVQPSTSANLAAQPSTSANLAAQPSTSANLAAQPSTSANLAAQPSTSAKPAAQPSTSANPAGRAFSQTYLTHQEENQQPSTQASAAQRGFSPSALRPFPKAGPRKTPSGMRKKRQSETLTDTLVKQALEEEEKKRSTGKSVKKRINLPSGKGQKKKTKQTSKRPKPNDQEDSDTTGDENFCIVCMEHFANSRPKEAWLMCVRCQFWAHKACTPGADFYICNCNSD